MFYLLQTEPAWAPITTAVATAATAVILAATAIFVGRQLRDAKRTRHAMLLTDLSGRWDDAAFVESQHVSLRYGAGDLVALIGKIYGEDGPTDEERNDLRKLEAIPNFWETIGVLAVEGAVSVSVVERMWGDAVLADWGAWDDAVDRLRELRKIPDAYLYFEGLAEAIKTQRRNPRLARRVIARLGAGERWPRKAFGLELQVSFLLRRKKDSS